MNNSEHVYLANIFRTYLEEVQQLQILNVRFMSTATLKMRNSFQVSKYLEDEKKTGACVGKRCSSHTFVDLLSAPQQRGEGGQMNKIHDKCGSHNWRVLFDSIEANEVIFRPNVPPCQTNCNCN